MSTRSLNKVMLIGNLTRDPELRYTPQGTAVATFGLATNREWTDSSGQKQEDTEFHRVVAWGKLAEICAQLLGKGRKVYVAGRLQTRSWQSQDGQERQATEVVIDEMIALGAPKDGGNVEEEFVPLEGGSSVSPEEEVFVGSGESVSEQDKDEGKKTTTKKKPVKKEKTESEDINDEIPF